MEIHYQSIDTNGLVHAMKQSRLNNRKLAKLSGYSEKFIRMIVQGKTTPTHGVLVRLCYHLDVEAKELIFAGPPTPNSIGRFDLKYFLETWPIDKKDLAIHLGVSVSSVMRWMQAGVPNKYINKIWALLERGLPHPDQTEFRGQILGAPNPELPHSPNTLATELVKISRDLIDRLRREPSELRRLPPRTFEEVVAELISDMGFDVQLTPESRDQGRDILAALNTPLGRILTLVECKRHQEENRIGPKFVERFLFTIRERDRANLGVMVSTGLFTRGARHLEDEYNWLLKLRDYYDLQEWLARYGKWSLSNAGDLWLPMVGAEKSR